MTPITFTIYGKAQPAGSKTAVPLVNRYTKQPVMKNGRIITNTFDSNPNAKPWMAEVKAAAREVYRGPLLECALSLTVVVYRARNKGDFGSGKNAGVVKASAPQWPTTKPDLLKLTRAIEDALSDVLYRDDAQICHEVLIKKFGDVPRVEVTVAKLEADDHEPPVRQTCGELFAL